MVICIVALVVFAVLGIFSAKYRKLAMEAFECVGKSITFRPCTSQLDQRIKTALTARLLRINKWLARFVYKHFKLLSWIFTVSFFASMFYTVFGIINYILYGNCDPGQPAANCFINQAKGTLSSYSILTCSTAQAIYAAIIIVVAGFLIIRYLNKRKRRNVK